MEQQRAAEILVEQRALSAVESLCRREFRDYSWLDKYAISLDYDDGEDFHFTVKFPPEALGTSDISLKVVFRESEVEVFVELGEDNWEHVEWFEPSVKYLWMALLWQT